MKASIRTLKIQNVIWVDFRLNYRSGPLPSSHAKAPGRSSIFRRRRHRRSTGWLSIGAPYQVSGICVQLPGSQ
jgi:hypothetical protein